MNQRRPELSRYAIGLLRRIPFDGPVTLPITVRAEKVRQPKAFVSYHRHNGKGVDNFLDSFGFNSLLLGAPGSGKSFALQSHVRRRAASLLAALPDGQGTELVGNVVPIYIDLKQYAGSLERMLQSEVGELDLASLITEGHASFIVDSFNEAPRHYSAAGTLRNDLQRWIDCSRQCRWIIASRVAAGLELFEGEHFTIGDLEEDFVANVLTQRNVDLGQRHARDILQLLRKPIFLSALLAGRLSLRPGGTHPAEAIEGLIGEHLCAVRTTVGVAVDLPALCGDLAVEAIDGGNELFKIADVCAALCTDSVCEKDAMRVVESLIKTGLLHSYGGGKVAFYHQSITELIASKQIAGRMALHGGVVDGLLRSRHWDDCLPLIMYYLNRDLTKELFDKVLSIDAQLAVRCARASEFDRAELVSRVLDYVLQLPQQERLYDWPFIHSLHGLPVDTVHVPRLRMLLGYPGAKGGLAASLLANAIGAAAIAPIMDAVIALPEDYNLGKDAGEAVAEHMTSDLIDSVLELVTSCDLSRMKRSSESGIVQFVAMSFKKLPAERVCAALTDRFMASKVVREAISNWAFNNSDAIRLRLLLEWVAKGDAVPVFAIYMRLRFCNAIADVEEILDDGLREQFMRGLCLAVLDRESCSWAAEILQWFHDHDESSASTVVQSICELPSVLQIVLRAKLYRDDVARWAELEMLFVDSSRRFDAIEYELMSVLSDLKWEEHEGLFLKLLQRGDSDLTQALLGIVYRFLNAKLTWDYIESLLPWYSGVVDNPTLRIRFAEFVARNADDESRERLVAEVLDKESLHRAIIADCILAELANVSPLLLSDETVCYLVERLHHIELPSGEASALGKAATHKQIDLYLLPLLPNASDLLRTNLDKIIETAGRRLRVRF